MAKKDKPSKPSIQIKGAAKAAKETRALGALLAEHAASIIGGAPTTGTAKETGVKGGDKAPDDAAPDFDPD